ncbi:ankyrin repeat domain-containing protein 60-like [Oncorhynchus kisutch]|nr:ankyrin repeat domain-containing protein 60-like [Oncorhynchus kisutch]XP_031674882.1 ankyrin repeat domain-containing protein 60 [Oncorhynchus kisutch]XP_031681569.1 ankyrin repeat domain-containing protein 60-like [Oncorhynchus kisutch]
MFVVPDCHHNMRIRELKNTMELVVGIPTDFQRVCYLDNGDLCDDTTIHCNDIVPGTTVTLMIWPYDGWAELVIAAATGNVFKLKSVMSKPAPPRSSHLSAMGSMSGAPSWLSHRLFSALFISAHRGHMPAVRFLLQQGANVKGQTPLGRGALHAAAAQGQLQSIQELLVRGAPHQLEDAEGMTALRTAMRWDQRKSTRQLFLFHWQERAQGVRLKPHLDETELFAHQKHDSQLCTWHRGAHAQRYMAHLRCCSRGVEGMVEVRQLGPPQNTAMRAQARRAWMGDA